MKGKLMIHSLLAVSPLIPLSWLILKDYQKERIISFLQPASDPLGAGYHTAQSVIAIGSGQWTGKGWLAGSQTQLKFLPEQQTDFVFSVLAEEWGFIGAMVVLLLLLTLISLGMKIAVGAKEVSGAIIALGVTTFIALAILVNIGMVLGLLPVVGIPLPFLSYGGSSTLVVLTGIGLLLNVRGRRFLLQS
jgi:rod shape determining protein RodA